MKSDPSVVVLNEYAGREVDLTLQQAQTLRRLCRDRLTVEPGETPGRWRLTASSHVGTIVTPDVRVLIRPKVTIQNLFYLLEARGRPVTLSRDEFDYERTADLIPSFATFFAKYLEAALCKGIPRNYVEVEHRSMSLRGRVNLAAQRRLTGLPLPLECRFDEYTADIQLNRILLAATIRLLRLPGIALSTRGRLQHHANSLEEVTGLSIRDLDTSTIFSRLTEHCRPAEHLARVILKDSTLLDAVGASGAAAFLLDMNKIFEEFVGSRLRRYLARQLAVHEQWNDRLDVNGDVSICPDLVFDTPGGVQVYVSDCKYKVTTDGFGRQADYYQLNAYATALNLREGLLIYCQTSGSPLSREIQVRHGGPTLRSWSVRLDGTASDIEAELQRLAAEIALRASAISISASRALRKVGGNFGLS